MNAFASSAEMTEQPLHNGTPSSQDGAAGGAMLQQSRPSWADDADAADTRPANNHAAAGSEPTAATAEDGPPPGFEHVQPEQHADQLARGLAGVTARPGSPVQTALSAKAAAAGGIPPKCCIGREDMSPTAWWICQSPLHSSSAGHAGVRRATAGRAGPKLGE